MWLIQKYQKSLDQIYRLEENCWIKLIAFTIWNNNYKISLDFIFVSAKNVYRKPNKILINMSNENQKSWHTITALIKWYPL